MYGKKGSIWLEKKNLNIKLRLLEGFASALEGWCWRLSKMNQCSTLDISRDGGKKGAKCLKVSLRALETISLEGKFRLVSRRPLSLKLFRDIK